MIKLKGKYERYSSSKGPKTKVSFNKAEVRLRPYSFVVLGNVLVTG